MAMKIFRRPTPEVTAETPTESDTPIWDALLAEHNRSGTPVDLFADVDLGLRPETRAWFRRHRRTLADEEPAEAEPTPETEPVPVPIPEPEPAS